jgi:c-di-AMP phosphodiesterase-like protein
MKKFSLMSAMLICMMIILLSSCTVVGGIFKAGVWVGVLGIVILVVIIFWIISKAGKK